jgi:hypothetical protein
MKPLAAVLFLIVASVAVPILASTVAAQGFDRDSCIRGCAWLRPVPGRNYGGQWMNYQNCVSDCEKRFWDNFDEETRDLERERDQD